MTSAQVLLEGVTKAFGRHDVLRGIDLSIARGDIVALLGPSGCGKTTLLRCIAGLEEPTAGVIEIGGKVVYASQKRVNAPPEQRRIGLVFQSYALWPHLTVGQNVAYGLDVRGGLSRAEVMEKVGRILATVGLGAMADRYPSTLSGGQQQRVALARSLVVEAEVILFDEPLSNLDLKLREEMRFELRRLIKRVGVTAVFVTHDQSEAMVLADWICLLQGGAVVQDGSPRDVYEEPATRFAMDFLGTSNFPAGRFDSEGRWCLPSGEGLDVAAGTPGTLVGIRPERIEILPAGTAGANILSGRIRDAVFLGASTIYEVDTGGTSVQVASTDGDHPVGSTVSLWFPTRWLKRVAA